MFGTRYYDASVGRWTQQDPSGMDANLYAYVGGDPMNSVDPTGLSLCAIKANNSDDLGSGCVGGSLWKKFQKDKKSIPSYLYSCAERGGEFALPLAVAFAWTFHLDALPTGAGFAVGCGLDLGEEYLNNYFEGRD
jgi:hypothetical protein